MRLSDWDAAFAAGCRAERERIRQLAIREQATYRPDDPDLPGITGQPGTKPGPDPLGDPFADLLDLVTEPS